MPPVAQSYREQVPRLAPSELVTCTWIQRIATESGPYVHRVVPHGCIDILCRPGFVPRVVGPQTKPTVETLRAGTTVVGVRLRPGQGPAVLGVPASELVDSSIALDHLWGRQAIQLGERIAEAPSPQTAEGALEREIRGRIADRLETDPLVEEVVAVLARCGQPVGSLAPLLGISLRQIRRRFHSAVGYGPKTLQRILRFQRFLALAQPGSAGGLARLAAELGFVDQAHLSNECRRLSGMTPDTFIGAIARTCRDHDHHVSLEPWVPAEVDVRAGLGPVTR